MEIKTEPFGATGHQRKSIQRNGFNFFGKVYTEEDIQAMGRQELNILIAQMGDDIDYAEDKKSRLIDQGEETYKVDSFLRVAKAFQNRLKLARDGVGEPTDEVVTVLGEAYTVRYLKAFFIAADNYLDEDTLAGVLCEADLIEGELK